MGMKRAIALVFAMLLSAAGAPAQTLPSPVPSQSPSPSPVPSATPLAALIASPSALQSNIGKPVSVTIAGGTPPLTATLDPKLGGVTVSGAAVTLQPIRNGTATLHVSDANGAAVDVPVKIAPNAGTVAPALTVKVTGASVDPAFIAQQVSLALGRVTAALPGAVPQIGQIAAPALPLGPGGQTAFSVPVTIAGGDQYLDVSGTTQVSVQNVASAPFAPPLLYYSDDPERIESDGVLFRATLTTAQPVRLYDYHENGPQRRRLVVALQSASTAPSSLHVIEAFAGPNADVMSVGHAVTRNFLTYKPRNQGVVVDLDDGAPFYLRDLSAGNREGIAAATDFRLLLGGPVTLTVLAVSPGVNPATLLDAPVLAGDGKLRRGSFLLSDYGSLALNYTAGGADASTAIGDREPTVPKADPNEPGRDFGDYGVLFTMNVTLSNPTDTPQTLYFYESPRGGPARASYLVDGQLFELGCGTSARSATAPPNRYQIGLPVLLAPHATQTHLIQTMTDGGSNLPIEVGVTATPPQPTTPPISAPDGCFPKANSF